MREIEKDKEREGGTEERDRVRVKAWLARKDNYGSGGGRRERENN